MGAPVTAFYDLMLMWRASDAMVQRMIAMMSDSEAETLFKTLTSTVVNRAPMCVHTLLKDGRTNPRHSLTSAIENCSPMVVAVLLDDPRVVVKQEHITSAMDVKEYYTVMALVDSNRVVMNDKDFHDVMTWISRHYTQRRASRR